MKLGGIYISVKAKIDKLKKDLASAKTMTKKAAVYMQHAVDSISFKKAALAATAFGAAGIYAFQKITKEAIKFANEQEAVEKRLSAVIKATDQAAGFNIKQMGEMASSYQKLTIVGDEVILSGQAILATFKTIRGEGFERATMAALDMAEVMQQDLKGAMVMIGKSMNDPIANLSAMTRSGVQFTKSQKDMIKSLWEAGDVMGAQNIILTELESQFGGAAKAARETFGGAAKAAGNALGDLKEELGFTITKSKFFIELAHETEKAFIGWAEVIKEHRGELENLAINIWEITAELGKWAIKLTDIALLVSGIKPGVWFAEWIDGTRTVRKETEDWRGQLERLIMTYEKALEAAGKTAAEVYTETWEETYEDIIRKWGMAEKEKEEISKKHFEKLEEMMQNWMELRKTIGKSAAKIEKMLVKENYKNHKTAIDAMYQDKKAHAAAMVDLEKWRVNEEKKIRENAMREWSHGVAETYAEMMRGEREFFEFTKQELDDLIAHLGITAKAYAELFSSDIIKKELTKTTTEMDYIFRNFLESVQDSWANTFEDVFRGQWEGWEDLMGDMKDLLIRTLAEMVAAAAMQRIVVPMVAQMGIPGLSGQAQQMMGQGGYGQQAMQYGAGKAMGYGAGGWLSQPMWGGQPAGWAATGEFTAVKSAGPTWGQGLSYAGAALGAYSMYQGLTGGWEYQRKPQAGISGATAGAAMGMPFGLIGMGIGAIAGGLLGAIVGGAKAHKFRAEFGLAIEDILTGAWEGSVRGWGRGESMYREFREGIEAGMPAIYGGKIQAGAEVAQYISARGVEIPEPLRTWEKSYIQRTRRHVKEYTEDALRALERDLKGYLDHLAATVGAETKRSIISEAMAASPTIMDVLNDALKEIFSFSDPSTDIEELIEIIEVSSVIISQAIPIWENFRILTGESALEINAISVATRKANAEFDSYLMALREVGIDISKITDLEDRRNQAIKKEIDNLLAPIIKSIQDQIFSLTTSIASPLTTIERMALVAAEIAATGIPTTPEEVGTFQSLYGQYLQLAQEAYQRPSAEYKAIFDQTISDLNYLSSIAEGFKSEYDVQVEQLQVLYDIYGTLQGIGSGQHDIDYVPHTGLYHLHQGERVTPAGKDYPELQINLTINVNGGDSPGATGRAVREEIEDFFGGSVGRKMIQQTAAGK